MKKSSILGLTSLFVSFMLLCGTAMAGETWLRITDPAVHFRGELPAEAMDYGRFVWLPASAAPGLEGRPGVQRIDNPFAMTVGERRFDPLDTFPRGSSEWFTGGGHSGPDFHLVQFFGPIRNEWLDDLRGAGLEPVQYLHPFTYIVWGTPTHVEAARSLSSVRWSGEMLPAQRVPIQARKTESDLPYTMGLIYRPAELETVNALTAAGAQVVSVTSLNTRFSVVELRARPDHYLHLARIPGVFTIQQIGQDAGPRGETSNQSIVGGYDGDNVLFPGYLDWLTPTGVDGSGVIAGIVDGGVRETHQDLAGRMVPCISAGGSPTTCTASNNAHGTHVAGAVGGTGASGVVDGQGFLRGQGVAPGVSMIQQRYNSFIGGGPGGMIPEGMLTIYKESALSGALLTNNSWGPTGTPQGYDIPTMEIDMITRDANPDTAERQPVLPVWSIMNGNGDSFGACAPSSLGSPDEAKNLFGVGSTNLLTAGGAQMPNELFSVSSNSGHGPACDGRLVPQIVAPGCRTDSTSSGSDTAFALNCGTSMASPVVTGAVAVYMEQYHDDHGEYPSPALVKAVFTALARDLAGGTDADGGILDHRPDRKQGWGRLDLDAVINRDLPLETINESVVFTTTGDNWTQTFTPEDPEEPMRIMLAWTDAPGPGTGGATPAWVNDLDLVADAGGLTFHGNNIDPDTGFSMPGGDADLRNNLEGIMLSPAQHLGQGVNVEVLAANLAGDGLDPWTPGAPRQDFALACYNCLTDPDFTIALEPTEASICLPDSVNVDIEIGSVLGFDDLVTLEVTSSPTNVSTNLAPTQVTPPGTSLLTIDAGAGAPLGSQSVLLDATSTTGTKTRTVSLVLADDDPGVPDLLEPADGAFNTARELEFEWSAAAQADVYLLEVATDTGFSNVVFQTTTTETSVEANFLFDSSTQYYWRVSVANACGGSESATFTFTTQPEPGDCPVGTDAISLFFDDMEDGEGDWIVSEDGIGNTWQLSDERSFSGDWSWHADDPASISDQRLISPAIELMSSAFLPITLRFQNWQEMESSGATACWDGSILEISTDDGETWTQVPDELLLTQPYDGTVNNHAPGPNPLTGLEAWCGDPVPWTDNVVDLSQWAGEEIRLRFRLGSDSIVGREGWYVDDVRVEACGVFEEVIFADGFESDPEL